AALATAPGKSGICVVRVSGPNSGTVAKQILDFDPTPRTAHLSKFKDENGDTIDEGIALFFSGPASFTGEDVLELQGHGGPSVQKLLLERVLGLGVRLANPGEFSERAFLNNKIDLVQAEAIADLIDANSAQAARSAIRTLSGEFSNKVNHLVAELTKIRVNIEAAIDFSDEDIDIITESRVREGLREITQTLSLALSQANQGMLLKEGMHVVIAGEPNAGKSSLLNALLGSESAIVTSIAGTTRDLLSESLQIEGMPVHITDTAGLRLSEDVVEQEGIRRAGEAVRQSDKILLVIDSTAVKTTIQQPVEIELSLSLIPQLLLDEPSLFAKTLVVFNKADLTPDARIGAGSVRVPNLLRAQEGVPATLDTITLSAKLNEGIEGLREALKNAIGFNSMVEGAFVARERHLLSLKAARKLIASAEQCFVDAMPFELAAEDLRLAQNELGRITGQISSDDLLGEIFSNFCVG
ncbi:MAG: tRNA uridine-5-carboxymethylaminomethyl(34) synthesis GTPase MnmE, partial [OM182 bacterium]|nr:tRNA uridine-5-carboxymethylaminomethyl(34) synthesis GTPase MnmE [OM182 bacterium]